MERAEWLRDYGLEQIPTTASAAELRHTVRLLLQLEEFPPLERKKAKELELLDRAIQLEPEDADAAALRRKAQR
jgi:hypothetical protein